MNFRDILFSLLFLLVQGAPTTVPTHNYGEITLAITFQYGWIWNDTGTGARIPLQMWRPQAQNPGFRPLGSVGENNYNDINDKRGTVMMALNAEVKPKDPKYPALTDPKGWDQRWYDNPGRGRYRGSIWRPICPTRYVCVGDVGVSSHKEPEKSAAWCVRTDLVQKGSYAKAPIWDDGSGSELLPLYAGGFRSDDWHFKNETTPWVPMIQVERVYKPFTISVPKITKDTIPNKDDIYSETKEAAHFLPLTLLFEPTDEKLLLHKEYPFANVTRAVSWIAKEVWVNDAPGTITHSESLTYGFTKAQSESFEHTAGIQINAGIGIKAVSFGVSLNYQFTYRKSTENTEFSNEMRTESYSLPRYAAAVLFVKRVHLEASSVGLV
ncbi:hypothetical protein NLG97_g3422 [Lecanicillium saksenae]|uniref:Uncharacterized protein n=1 Tax=Lecanicillium saksenae TaxID=468837 RepID=A0ACC1QY75_9HYPO|nr:hypothetical protein NLG97_g3422 [Lecanicillium saksenae]